MTRPVTDFRIDHVEIPQARFADLPAKARELIRVYGTPVKSRHPDVHAFAIAAYRWSEINAAIAQESGGTTHG